MPEKVFQGEYHICKVFDSIALVISMRAGCVDK